MLKTLLVFRPLNLLIVALLQLLTYYFLNYEHTAITLEVVFVIASSILITSAGYLFNDWMDRKADSINKPTKQYIVHWSNVAMWSTFILFNALALVFSFLVNTQLLLWHSGVILLLFAYSTFLKRLPLLGNFAISLIAGFSVYVIYMVFGYQDKKLILFYTGFAALLTYLREIVKDIEDIEGDQQAKFITFPVIAGIRQSKTIVLITVAFILVCYGNLLFQWVGGQFKMPIKAIVLAYHVLTILLPLLAFAYLSYTAKHKEDFTQLSALAKYVMATGVLSMMFY